MKKYLLKIGAVFMAAVMIACVPVNVNAASMQFIYKNTPVNCTISRNSSVMQVITTASGATCHSGGKYQLMRVNSGSADPVASFSPKSATASCAISKNVSSGMTCIYLKGNHSITVGGSTSSVHSQTEGSIK